MSIDIVKNCWSCNFQDNWGPATFLGKCKYFEEKGKEAKEIPPALVDIGCKFWKERVAKEVEKDAE